MVTFDARKTFCDRDVPQEACETKQTAACHRLPPHTVIKSYESNTHGHIDRNANATSAADRGRLSRGRTWQGAAARQTTEPRRHSRVIKLALPVLSNIVGVVLVSLLLEVLVLSASESGANKDTQNNSNASGYCINYWLLSHELFSHDF